MIWYIAEYNFYYSNLHEIKLNNSIKAKNVIVLPNEMDIKRNIGKNDVAFLTHYAPPQNKNLSNKMEHKL